MEIYPVIYAKEAETRIIRNEQEAAAAKAAGFIHSNITVTFCASGHGSEVPPVSPALGSVPAEPK
jgi:hypothetical protein